MNLAVGSKQRLGESSTPVISVQARLFGPRSCGEYRTLSVMRARVQPLSIYFWAANPT
jgi:hypothetical protein